MHRSRVPFCLDAAGLQLMMQAWRDLQAAMRAGSWHVFHFIGRGEDVIA
jgi:hypothetical protein